MDASQLTKLPLAEQAAYWHRVLNDEPTPERHAAFEAWMRVSPRHVAEFQLAQEVEKRLQRFHRAYDVDVDLLIQRARRERRTRRAFAMAASMVAVLGILLSTGIFILHDSGEIYVATERQQLINLEDGSVVALNVQSAVRVAFSPEARDLYLERGQGIFRVRHDAKRPFRVHAGPAVVEAVGTQFDVQIASDQATVVVVEGVVRLKSNPSTTRAAKGKLALAEIPRIAAGESATLRQDGETDGVKTIDVAEATEWRRAAEKLEFKNDSLAEIAEEFNRHNAAPKLRIEGDGLRNRRFMIMFNSAAPDSLLSYLARDETLEFVQDGVDIIVRERAR